MPVLLHPRVLELVASRICHDLVSPVGAIGNGVELMRELGADAGEEAVQLVEASAKQAAIRLKCFRLCYGAAGTDGNLGIKDIRELFLELVQGGRVRATFAPGLDAALSMPQKGVLKSLLNILLLAEECAHGEGAITAEAIPGNVRVTIESRNAAFRPGAADALAGDTAPDDLDPRLVHAFITGAFARHFGLSLSSEAAPEGGKLAFTLAL
jgi:histidine phosphotransferase ChpT